MIRSAGYRRVGRREKNSKIAAEMAECRLEAESDTPQGPRLAPIRGCEGLFRRLGGNFGEAVA